MQPLQTTQINSKQLYIKHRQLKQISEFRSLRNIIPWRNLFLRSLELMLSNLDPFPYLFHDHQTATNG
jgi:hypothetical protein